MIDRWDDVVGHCRPGSTLRPLVGGSTMVVEMVDDDRVCVRQRLWRACLTRAELATADRVLAAAGSVSPMQLAELLRIHYAGHPQVGTECSRVPNLSAVVLNAVGAFGPAASRPAAPGPAPGPGGVGR
jgi:hypothetical protein